VRVLREKEQAALMESGLEAYYEHLLAYPSAGHQNAMAVVCTAEDAIAGGAAGMEGMVVSSRATGAMTVRWYGKGTGTSAPTNEAADGAGKPHNQKYAKCSECVRHGEPQQGIQEGQQNSKRRRLMADLSSRFGADMLQLALFRGIEVGEGAGKDGVLLSAGSDGLLRLWDWRNGLMLRVLHESASRNNRAIALGGLGLPGQSGMNKKQTTRGGSSKQAHAVAFSGGEDGSLMIWRFFSGLG
jgi:hypothetical protein